ncbi:hypothetical protein D3C87_234400 [compost metagenome]
MKQLILLSAATILSTVGFSQQVASSERKTVITGESKTPGEILQTEEPDSVGTVYSSSRIMKVEQVPLSPEKEPKPEKQSEKMTVSSAKKPD